MGTSIRIPGAGLLLVFLVACGGGGGGGGSTGGSGAAGVNSPGVYVNPNESALYRFTADDGSALKYGGSKDASGEAETIRTLDYTDPQGRQYQITFDDYGLPAKVTDADGMTVELDFLAGIPGLREGGAVALSRSEAVTSVAAKITVSGTDPVEQIETTLNLDTPVVVSIDQALADLNRREPVGNVSINIQQCSEPADPSGSVFVRKRGVSSALWYRYEAFKTSQTGQWVARVPVRAADPVPGQLQSACGAFANVLDAMCNVLDPTPGGSPSGTPLTNPASQAAICAQLGLAASAVLTPLGGAKVAAACTALLAGGTFACGTLGISPSPGADNAAQKMCRNVESSLQAVDSALGLDTVVLQAVADFRSGPAIAVPGTNPGIAASPETTVSAFGPYPPLAINTGTPAIDRLYTQPNPAVRSQNYTATAEMSCVTQSDLSLTLLGDGGYTDGIAGPAAGNRDSLTLGVPGGAALTRNVLTASATDRVTSQSVSQKLTVVFESTGMTVSPPELPNGEVDVEYFFTLTAGGVPEGVAAVTFEWNFGDGSGGATGSRTVSVSNGRARTVISHTFNVDGGYGLTAVVKDDGGTQLAQASAVITVGTPDIRDEQLNVCDVWQAAQSGGDGATVDNWDITAIPSGATFDIDFNAYSIPDKFLAAYPGGTLVLDTGWRGSSSYDGDPRYPGGIAGPGVGQVGDIFTKTSVNSFKVTIIGGGPGTAWNYRIRCRIP